MAASLTGCKFWEDTVIVDVGRRGMPAVHTVSIEVPQKCKGKDPTTYDLCGSELQFVSYYLINVLTGHFIKGC